MTTRLPILALLLTGCLDSKVQSDFNVQLVPRSPVGQDPVAQAVELGVVLRGRNTTVVTPGPTEPDSTAPSGVEALGLGPLDEAYIGIVGTDDLATLTTATVFSYGETGPFTLSKDDAPMDVDVLVAEADRVGLLASLADDQSAQGGAVVMTAAGDVFRFGGLNAGAPTDTIARLTDLDAGDWRFQGIGAMPGGARVGMTATLVDNNGTEAILVTGGRTSVDGTDANSDAAFLIGTADGLVSWTGTSRTARSGHTAVPLANGRVLLVGGFTGATEGGRTDAATFEIFDPGFQVFNSGASELPIPSTGFAAANVGGEGVLLCGGYTVSETGESTPTDTCVWVSPLGAIRDAPALPVPLTGLAMAAVADRHVLAVGGIPGVIADGESSPATSQVWLYTVASDSWQELDPMVTPRALHRALPTPSGRVIITGGVRNASADAATVQTAVECTEVYDPIARTLAEGGCDAVGSGGLAPYGAHPDHGALVFTGLGGTAGPYGFVPYPPEL